MPVPALKERIASVTGIVTEHQRLICRGKVLKDDQLLSAYRILSFSMTTVLFYPNFYFFGGHLFLRYELF